MRKDPSIAEQLRDQGAFENNKTIVVGKPRELSRAEIDLQKLLQAPPQFWTVIWYYKWRFLL
jgi:hypothetical protein